ncbi:hypothetical protein ABG067_008309, partial [Albugo candida]
YATEAEEKVKLEWETRYKDYSYTTTTTAVGGHDDASGDSDSDSDVEDDLFGAERRKLHKSMPASSGAGDEWDELKEYIKEPTVRFPSKPKAKKNKGKGRLEAPSTNDATVVVETASQAEGAEDNSVEDRI